MNSDLDLSSLRARLVGLPEDAPPRLDAALESAWMAYQPIVHRSDGRRFGYEALLRSREPGLENPISLLAAAVDAGRLRDVGRRVRDLVLDGPLRSGVDGTVFINLHPDDLGDPRLMGASPLTDYAGDVVLELTECGGPLTTPMVREQVAILRRRGFRIALDDLGSGHSGLAALVALRPDIVKIDRSLISGIERDRLKRRLVKSLVSICREENVLVIAEGVESVSERDVVVDLGADLLQGLFTGAPSPEYALRG